MGQNDAKFFKLSLLFVVIILWVGKIDSSRRTSSGSSSSRTSHSSRTHAGTSYRTGGFRTGNQHQSSSSGIGFGNTHRTNSGYGSGGTQRTNTGFGSGNTHHTNTGLSSGGSRQTGGSNTGFGNSHNGISGNTHSNGQHQGGLSSTHTITGGIGFTNQGGPIRATNVNPVGGGTVGSTHHSGGSGSGFGSGNVNGQHQGGLSATHKITGGIGFTNQGGPIRSTNVNPVGSGQSTGTLGNTHNANLGFRSGGPGISGNTPLNGQQHGGLSSTHTITGGVGFTNQGGPVQSSRVNPVGGSNPSAPVGTNTRPIGFEHLNNQHSAGNGGSIPQTRVNPVGSGNVHNPVNTNVQSSVKTHTTNNIHVTNTHITNTNHANVGYHPYQAQTVVIPGGGIHYHPAVQLQYVPPVHTVHVVPLYDPFAYVHSYPSVGYSSGIGLGTSFLSGYLIGKASGLLSNGYNNQNSVVHHHDSTQHVYHHNVNDNDNNKNNQQQTNNYYTVHNHYQNKESVPTKFSIPGTSAVECPSNTSESLCVPNTNAICLKNETIMCVTNNLLTVPCGPNNTLQCVYTKIECNGDPSCNTTANQTYIDFYVPCVANVTLFNNIIVDTDKHDVKGNYELCVTAIAEPKKSDSPAPAAGSKKERKRR